jgi:hypothetical protein
MKKCFQLSLLFAMIFCFVPDANAFAVDVKATVEKTTLEDFPKAKSQTSFSKKELRKARGLNRGLTKFQQKWEMRSAKKSLKKNKKRRRFFGGAADDMRFKIGLLLFVASLLLGILARVPIFGGLFGVLAGLAGLVGLVLMFLAFLEYY